MPTRHELKQQTHARLLSAMLDVIRSAPDESPHVLDVANAACLSPGTFYLHFPSLGAAIQELRAKLLDDVAAVTKADMELATGIRAYIRRGLERRDDVRAVCRAAAGLAEVPGVTMESSGLAEWLESRLPDDSRSAAEQRYVAQIAAQMIEAALLHEVFDDEGNEDRLFAGLARLFDGAGGLPIGIAPPSAMLVSRPTKIALRTGDQALTFAQLESRIAKAATMLREVGLKRGDTLCLLLRNGRAAVELTYAAHRAGFALVPMNTYWRSAETERILRNSSSVCVAFHEEFRSVLDGVDPALIRTVALLPVGSAAGEERYELSLGKVAEDLLPPENAALTVLYTSGSTDEPKGVLRMETTDERRGHALFLASVFGISAQDTVLVAGPLHHAANRMVLSAALHVGATSVLVDRFDPESFFRSVDEHGVSVTFVVPTMLYRLLRPPPSTRRRYDLSSLRRIIHAGGPCSPELKRAALEEFGPIVYEFFGTTEFGGTIISPDEWLAHPGSVGKPWDSSTRIRVVDEHGNDLSSEIVGMVALGNTRRAPFEYMTDGVAQKPNLLPDGSFVTGDLGRLDRDGYLYLADRRTAVIKTGGVPVYPSEVEAVIMTDPSVQDCVVVGLDDPEWGESVAAFVQPATAAGLDVDRLREMVRARLAHYKCPRQWFVAEAIPRDEGGKIARSDARSLVNRFVRPVAR